MVANTLPPARKSGWPPCAPSLAPSSPSASLRKAAGVTQSPSFGRDRQAHLLAGRRHVGDGGAPHVALVALVVELEPAMHGAAVVPHHQVVDPPAVGVDELALRGVIDKLLQELLGLRP